MESKISTLINTSTTTDPKKDVPMVESKLVGEVSSKHPILINHMQTGLGYVQRDKGVKTEEEQGLIEFMVVTNDK